MKTSRFVDLINGETSHQIFRRTQIDNRVKRHLRCKSSACTHGKECMQSCDSLGDLILLRLDCLCRDPRIIFAANGFECKRQQQFGGEFDGFVACHQLHHDVHRNGIPLARAIIPLHLHDLAASRKILADEMQFLVCDTHKVLRMKAAMMEFVPDFPS